MNLKPFDGELDPTDGLKPFDGRIDGESSGIIRRAADMGLRAAQGVIGVPEAAVGLADIATGGNAGKTLEQAGYRPKQAREFLGTFRSPEQQAADRAVSDADGFLPTIAAAVQNPSTIAGAVAESIPSTLGGGVIARGALKLAPAMGPVLAGAIGEGAVSAGQTAEQVRQETPDQLLTGSQAALAGGSGALTGVIGAASGGLARKLGLQDIDTLVASGKLAPGQGGLLRRLAQGALTEGVFEELPQSAQEQIAQNLALGKPWNEGVAQQAAMGMLAGAAMGAGANILHGPAKEAQPASLPTTPTPENAIPYAPVDRAERAKMQAENLSLAEAPPIEGIPFEGQNPLDRAQAVEQAVESARQDEQSIPDEPVPVPSSLPVSPESQGNESPEPRLPEAGPLSRAANVGIDTGAASLRTPFPFASEAAAKKAAADMGGEERAVIPHPEQAGRFAVVPAREVSAAKVDAFRAQVEAYDSQVQAKAAEAESAQPQGEAPTDIQPTIEGAGRARAVENAPAAGADTGAGISSDVSERVPVQAAEAPEVPAGPGDAQAVPQGEVAPAFVDYAAPRGDRANQVRKGQIRTFTSEKQAATFAKKQGIRGYAPREVEPTTWVLSKPFRERTARQKANDARLRADATQIRASDDLLTTLHKAGGVLMHEVDGADPSVMRELNQQGFGKPFRKTRGLTMDGVAEVLAENGWDVLDPETGNPDASRAREILEDALSGDGKVYNAEGQEAQAARDAEQRAAEERPYTRTDNERRQRIAQMTPEEMRRELLTSPKAGGLPNERAYEERQVRPVQGTIDLDGLAWINDTMGHEYGDKMIRAMGLTLQHLRVDAYHLHGDEFATQADTDEELQQQMDRTHEILAQVQMTAPLEDGSKVIKKGIDFSFGTGSTVHEAEAQLRADKQDRTARGLRAERKAEPPGVAREPAVAPGGTRGGTAAVREEAVAEAPPETPADAGVSAYEGGDIKRFELGKKLTPAERKRTLESLQDVYRVHGLHKELAGTDRNGNEIWRYPYSPDLFEKSDITGAMVRYYVTLPDGKRAHPSELFPEVDAAYIKRKIDAQISQELEDNRRADAKDHDTYEAASNSAIAEWDLWQRKSDKSLKSAFTGEPTISPPTSRVMLEKNGRYHMEPVTFTEQINDLKKRGWKEIKYSGEQAARDRAGIQKSAEPDWLGSLLGESAATPRLALTGETESEIRAREARDAKAAEDQRKAEAAPSPSGFTLTGSDRTVDEARAKGQQELVPAKPGIADFGEKIGGARKDVWQSFSDDMKAALDVDVAAQPLSKSWPVPDYQALLDNGADPWAVAFMHAARDAIPPKPRVQWKVKSWATLVRQLREITMALANGTASIGRASVIATLQRMDGSRAISDIAGRTELYQLVGHGKSLEGVRISSGEYSLYQGVNYDPPRTIWTVEKDQAATAFSNWPRVFAEGDTREAAMAKFKEAYDSLQITKPASKEVAFDIFSKRGENGFWIGKKIGRNPTLLEGPFPTVKEARAYKAEHQSDLETKLAKVKEIPAERRETNEPRVGADMRNGQDVTPQMFGESFGFRGVEFGNWVEQGRRQKDLNEAFDALMDMAAVLGVPPKALSLNGELGLAFGARGAGGLRAAAAHYEQGKVVINLTKTQGAGSLGHEWWHALDNYFSRQRAQADDFATEALDVSLASRDSNFQANSAMRREMVQAFGAVVKAIRETAIKARASKLDAKRTKEYWTTTREMAARAFESYLISKLQDQNASNDYLANVVDEATWKAAESLGFELDDSYPYPTAGEIPAIRAGFDHFFATVQTRETDKGVALFRRGAESTRARESFTLAQVQSVADTLSKRWANGPQVKVIEEMGEAPQSVLDEAQRQYAKGAQGVPYAFFHDGTVYVIASEVRDMKQIVTGLFHEALGHYGLRGVFGDKLNDVLAQIATVRKADVAAKAKQYGLDMDKREDRLIAAEEVLAEMAQSRPQIGFVQRAIAALKNYLRSLGLDLSYSDDDIIANFLLPARGFVERGQGTVSEEATARFARTPAWVAEGPEALKSAAAKIDTYAPQNTARQKINGLAANWKERLIQNAVDSFAPLKRLGPQEYMLARMVKAAEGALEGMMLFGKPKLLADGSLSGELDQKGLFGALSDLNGEHDRFLMWMAGNRAARLMKEGREHLFSADEIKAMQALNTDKMTDGASRAQAYAKVAETFNAYNKAVLDIAERTGLIDGESRHLWEHDFYVPFFRVDEDMTLAGPSRVKGLVRQKAFEKLKGGSEPLGDLLDNYLRNASHLLSASIANQAAVANLKAAERVGIAREVTSDTKGAVYAMQGGKKIHYEVDDPFVLTAISAMETTPLKGPAMQVMGAFKHALTLGVTAAPAFRLRNLMRDTVTALGVSEIGANPIANVMQGWKATDRKGEDYQQALFSGALMRFGYLTDGKHAEHAKRLIASGVKDQTILDTSTKVKDAIGKLWDQWQEFGDRMENVNRLALYKQLLAQGKTPLEAAFQARDMMDFSLQGSSVAVRFLAQVVPFFNARLQGLYKLGRAGHENPARLGYVLGATTLASIALLLAYGGDDDWKKREDWDRDNFWWFKVGNTAYRIPKPFEIGAMATIAERGLELAISDEMTGKRFAERMKNIVSDQLSMNPTPQFFKPMLDVYANVDSFTGRQIETRGMEGLSKPERASPNSSVVAKTLGKAGEVTNLSPVQIDHLIRGYFGWLGSHAAMTVDLMAQPFMADKPTRKVDDYFLAGDFAKSLPSSQSRYLQDFYKQAKEVHEVMGDIRHAREVGDVEKVKRLLEDHKDKVALHALYQNAERRIGVFTKQLQKVQSGPLSADEKRAEIDRLSALRNTVAETVQRAATRQAAAR